MSFLFTIITLSYSHTQYINSNNKNLFKNLQIFKPTFLNSLYHISDSIFFNFLSNAVYLNSNSVILNNQQYDGSIPSGFSWKATSSINFSCISCSFFQCKALGSLHTVNMENCGGGIYLSSPIQTLISKTLFHKNECNFRGGGICISGQNSGSLKINECNFTENKGYQRATTILLNLISIKSSITYCSFNKNGPTAVGTSSSILIDHFGNTEFFYSFFSNSTRFSSSDYRIDIEFSSDDLITATFNYLCVSYPSSDSSSTYCIYLFKKYSFFTGSTVSIQNSVTNIELNSSYGSSNSSNPPILIGSFTLVSDPNCLLYISTLNPTLTLIPTPKLTPNPSRTQTFAVTPIRTPQITPIPSRTATFQATPKITPNTTPIMTPIRTPQITPIRTPQITPIRTPQMTPIRTPQMTPIRTPIKTPEITPINTFAMTKIETPLITLFDTPKITPIETLEFTPIETLYPTFENTPIDTLQFTPIITFDITLFDTPINTLEYTPIITLINTPNFTPYQTLFETPNITPEFTLYETLYQTPNNTPLETIKETPENTLIPSPEQTLIDTLEFTLQETLSFTPLDTLYNTFEDTLKITLNPTIIYYTPDITLNPTIDFTPINTLINTFYQTFQDSLINTLINTPINTLIETLEETFINTNYPTPFETLIYTPLITPYNTIINTLIETPLNTNTFYPTISLTPPKTNLILIQGVSNNIVYISFITILLIIILFIYLLYYCFCVDKRTAFQPRNSEIPEELYFPSNV